MDGDGGAAVFFFCGPRGAPVMRACRCLFILLLFLYGGLVTVQAFTGTYGINYGRVADNIPPPEAVVAYLKEAKIKNARIYDADHSVLEAFKGSGLELVVGIPNEYLKNMSTNEDQAVNWIKENVQAYLPDTHIRGIAVGNEVLGGSDQELVEALSGAIRNVYNALSKLQLTDVIEVLTPHSQAVFDNSYPPSSCTFKENVLQYMKPILDLFSKIDAAYAALEAAGYEEMEVRVSETGWASKGDEDETGATAQNARTYNYNLLKRLAKKKGTPRRPKMVVKAYVFALFNEDLKPGSGSERHYGLLKSDGSIAYDIGFSGLTPS
ncbi:glucan endo-1,3-beta-glucosidase 14-like isoform X3 [Phoenix dactylifera]|uniref:Glucan endo-1,3-beta-glucosidase 14-like isoform X3 n=1 Tax=Phoenix dactylifera TaxID=42345 RepID=A0A8B8ZW87_PHODC|nr:glucan endo-1,3-beta-glucosidase 14-like isoform X3 [Phoenix dactylifera]